MKTISKETLGFLLSVYIADSETFEVGPGETREDSWKRHVTAHPESQYANIRVFNRGRYAQIKGTLEPA